jgi:hypothetical protein
MSGESTIGITLLVLQALVFVMSCSGNAVVVIVIWKYLRRSAVTNRFIINLAVADMFTGLASLSKVWYTIVPDLNNNLYTCLLRYSVVMFMTLTSQLTVSFTTFDRYIAIFYPTRYVDKMNPKECEYSHTRLSHGFILLPFCEQNTWNTHLVCVFQQLIETWQLL